MQNLVRTPKNLGHAIRQARREKNWTQAELATRSGVRGRKHSPLSVPCSVSLSSHLLCLVFITFPSTADTSHNTTHAPKTTRARERRISYTHHSVVSMPRIIFTACKCLLPSTPFTFQLLRIIKTINSRTPCHFSPKNAYIQ